MKTKKVTWLERLTEDVLAPQKLDSNMQDYAVLLNNFKAFYDKNPTKELITLNGIAEGYDNTNHLRTILSRATTFTVDDKNRIVSHQKNNNVDFLLGFKPGRTAADMIADRLDGFCIETHNQTGECVQVYPQELLVKFLEQAKKLNDDYGYQVIAIPEKLSRLEVSSEEVGYQR